MNGGTRGQSLFRMAAFPLGIGITSVLINGTLNRIMIVEQGVPASFVGVCFALPLLIAPLRIWMGYQSDTRPVRGLRRTPYIVAGMLGSLVGLMATTMLVVAIPQPHLFQTLLLGSLLLGAFLVYGMGRHLASNSFEALIADVFHGPQRPRAVTIFKVVMFVGIIVTAIGLGILLVPYTPLRLVVIVGGIVCITMLLTLVAVVRVEQPSDVIQATVNEARAVSFRATIKHVLLLDPRLRRFFVLVMLVIIGTMAQDILLEPYGGLVLGMSPSQTTRLTALWGVGTVLAMLVAGLVGIQRFGYMAVLRGGILITIAVFAGLILVGIGSLPLVFQGLVFILGLGTGLAAAGLLTAVVEQTTAARAGTLMGVWGVAHEGGEALGGLLGGSVVDIVQLLGGDVLLAYSTVFALEGGILCIAFLLLSRVDSHPVQYLAHQDEVHRGNIQSLQEGEV